MTGELADAIVVLGCRLERGGHPSAALRRRLLSAERAWRAGLAPWIIVCGGRSWNGHVEAVAMKRWLEAAGVPAAVVTTEHRSLRTVENAALCAPLLRARGARRVVLISSSWHLPRALRAFVAVGLEPVTPTAALDAALAEPRPAVVERWAERLRGLSDLVERWLVPSRLGAALLVWLSLLALGSGCGEPSSTPAAASASAVPSASSDAGPPPRPANALLRAELGRRASAIGEAALASRDVTERRAAARALARIATADARPGLLRALADEDAEVVSWAAYGLGYSCAGQAAPTVPALGAAAARLTGLDAGGASLPLMAIGRAIGQCGGAEAESLLVGWIGAGRAAELAASYGLGDLAEVDKKLREETIVALLSLAAGDSLEEPLGDALYPITRLNHLPPSVVERALQVARESLARPGPTRAFAVATLARTEESGVELLAEIVRETERFDASERAQAARALGKLGRPGQRALAALLGRLLAEPAAPPSGASATAPAPGPTGALAPARLLGDGFGPLLSVVASMTAVGSARAELRRLAELPIAATEPRALRLRASLLRCTAAQLLVEREYSSTLLRACDLLDAAVESPGPPRDAGAEPPLQPPAGVGARAIVEAIGITGAEITGPRLRAWLAALEKGDLRARERAIELLVDHPEVEPAVRELTRALRAAEPGLVATAAEVITKVPARASAKAKAKRKADDDAEGPAGPPHPDIVAALLARLDGTGPTADVEALGAVIDAAGALRLAAAKGALEAHCRSPWPAVRARAQAALGKLQPEAPTVVCSAPANGAPLPVEIDRLLAAPVTLELDTDIGLLVLELDPERAPLAVTRVTELARAGFYRNMVVHRVVPGFVVQFGSPTADGYGGAPDRAPLPCETSPEHFGPFSVGVALSGRDTGSSQIFVTLGSFPHLDGRYAWLGTATGPWAALAEGDLIREVRVRARTAR